MRNTIEILGDDSAAAQIIAHTISGEFIDDEIIKIGARAFGSCVNLSSVSFPMATEISSAAFYGCTGLLTAVFPNATKIGGNAFYGCTSLSDVDIPKVTNIESTAFGRCASLTYVYLGDVTHIGAYAFNDCTNLSVAIIGVNSSLVCSLDMSNAFYHTSSNLIIYVPSSLYSLYVSAPQWTLISAKIRSYISE